jgi:hypothetical protein
MYVYACFYEKRENSYSQFWSEVSRKRVGKESIKARILLKKDQGKRINLDFLENFQMGSFTILFLI